MASEWMAQDHHDLCGRVTSEYSCGQVRVLGFRCMVQSQASTAADNDFTDTCSGSKEGSFLRLTDFCITEL